jgi:putative ABC transport system substrate-binding protein
MMRAMRKAGVLAILFALVLLAVAVVAGAQQSTKIPRIGYVLLTGNASNQGPYVEALRQGLRDLGHVDGKNIVIEYRGAEGKGDSIPSLVNELVQLQVDVLVVPTALSVPGISRIGVLRDADGSASAIGFKEYEAAARALKIALQSLELRGPNADLDAAFQAADKGRVNTLVTIITPPVLRYQKQIVDLAIKNRLPSMWERSDFVQAGGLVSYSSSDAESFRLAAYYVDRILKGAKPADLPVEQPTKFELVINLRTAKQIGVRIPPNVLARADRVIK